MTGVQTCALPISASSLEGKNEAFPLTPAEVLRFALIGPVRHVPICEPVLVTMWIKGSDWSGLEWSPTQTLWAETWRGGFPVAHPRMLPGGRSGSVSVPWAEQPEGSGFILYI